MVVLTSIVLSRLIVHLLQIVLRVLAAIYNVEALVVWVDVFLFTGLVAYQ